MPFPAQRSILAADALVGQVLNHYDLPTPLSCHLHTHGDNDTYMVTAQQQRAILRVYRANRHTQAAIEAEVAIVLALYTQGMSIAPPLPRRDGTYVQRIDASEGTRYAVLFAHSEGHPAGLAITAEQGYQYGRLIAQMHHYWDAQQQQYQRLPIDTHKLLTEPYAITMPFLQHRPTDQAFLTDVCTQTKQKLDSLPVMPPTYGLCHGDVHKTNILYNPSNQQLTLIDFDCLGYSWRAYELSVLWWSVSHASLPQANAVWEAYLRGYQELRSLSQQEHEALPYCVLARSLMITGQEIDDLKRQWGMSSVNDDFFTRKLTFLRDWVSTHHLF